MNFLLLFMITVATYSSNSFASFLCSKSDISNYERGQHIETNLNEFGLNNDKVIKIDKEAIILSSESPSEQSEYAFALKKKLQTLSNAAINKVASTISRISFIAKTKDDKQLFDKQKLTIFLDDERLLKEQSVDVKQKNKKQCTSQQEEWLTHIINSDPSNFLVLPICSVMDGNAFMSSLLPVTPSGLNYALPPIQYYVNTPAEWHAYFLHNASTLAHVCITQDFQVNNNTVKQFLITFKQIIQKVRKTQERDDAEEDDEEKEEKKEKKDFNKKPKSVLLDSTSTVLFDSTSSHGFNEEKEITEEIEEIKEINNLLDTKNYPAFKEKVLIAYFKQALGTSYTKNLGDAFKEQITTLDTKEDEPKQPVSIPQLPRVKKTTTGRKILDFLTIATAVLGGGAVCVGGGLFGLKLILHILYLFDKHIGLIPQR